PQNMRAPPPFLAPGHSCRFPAPRPAPRARSSRHGEQVDALLPAELRGGVGIDVAKSAQVVCALDVPRGTVRLKSTPIAANAAGHAHLLEWLGQWAAQAPARVLIGLESTGSRWEPLYDTLRQAGYHVALLNPHQTAAWATSLGGARQDRW